jgi:hypothetical protein
MDTGLAEASSGPQSVPDRVNGGGDTTVFTFGETIGGITSAAAAPIGIAKSDTATMHDFVPLIVTILQRWERKKTVWRGAGVNWAEAGSPADTIFTSI